jgi:pimeloyl-ACP methyl ester carboxylesterase
MYYETYGTGQPMLFIHGNGGSINNFDNQIPYFSKNYKVIIADSRSQGKSVDDEDGYYPIRVIQLLLFIKTFSMQR